MFCTISLSLYLIIKHHTVYNLVLPVTELKMYALIVSATWSEIFLVLRRNERDMIKMCKCLFVKYLLFLSDFNEN